MNLRKEIHTTSDKFILFWELVRKYNLTVLTKGFIIKKHYLLSQEDADVLLSKDIVDQRKKLKDSTIATGTIEELDIWLIHADFINLLANRGY